MTSENLGPRVVLVHKRPLFYLDLINGQQRYTEVPPERRVNALERSIGITDNIFSSVGRGKVLVYRSEGETAIFEDETLDETLEAELDLPDDFGESLPRYDLDADDSEGYQCADGETPIYPVEIDGITRFHPIVAETLESLPETPVEYSDPQTKQSLALGDRALEICHRLKSKFSPEGRYANDCLRTSVRIAVAVLTLEKDGRFYYVTQDDNQPVVFSEF